MNVKLFVMGLALAGCCLLATTVSAKGIVPSCGSDEIVVNATCGCEPTCCEPKPCRQKPLRNLLANLKAKCAAKKCCEPAAVCGGEPTCGADMIVAGPSCGSDLIVMEPSCGVDGIVTAAACGCEPVCCESKKCRKTPIRTFFANLKARFAAGKCCAPAVDCGCIQAEPTCGIDVIAAPTCGVDAS